jgi:hypothetical protein
MKQRLFLVNLIALTAMASLLFCTKSMAEPENTAWQWQIHTSLYTHHYHYNPEHNDHQRLVNLELYNPEEWIAGAAIFDNSFNQPSQYVYVGKAFHPLDDLPNLHTKVTAGFIHGYKGQYKNKIPFNSEGIAPAILPSIGYSYKRVTSEVIFLGTAGAMLTVGYKF